MITPIFDEFLKFCSEQNPETEIDHETFYTCALGEFSRSKDVSADEVLRDIRSEIRIAAGEDLSQEFYMTIGNAEDDHDLSTYGGLTDWLNRFHRRVVAAAQ